jgi:type IV pilus assembly protein PilQ
MQINTPIMKMPLFFFLIFICLNYSLGSNYTQASQQSFHENSSVVAELQLSPSSLKETISLNFQDVELRSVLQIIAEFAGFNLIVSDTVKGNITLRLEQVPWQQALEIVLKSKQLEKRIFGNVIMVGPIEEILAREKQELESIKQIQELGSLHSTLLPIKYARAEDLANLLKEKSSCLMTPRGSVSVDKRTNTLLIQDTESKLNEIRTLIRKLDVPVRQVEISTQIITADSTIEDAFGLRFALHNENNLTNSNPNSTNVRPGLFSDLGASTTSGGLARLGLALARLPNNTLLELELQALEFESKIKTIARPKLTTVDQNKAFVETGVEIPYQEMTAGGSASVAFKKAVLRLEVTPQITPDNKIVLDLSISNDSQGSIATQNTGTGDTSNVVGINTNKLQTKVLAQHGETIVLGGVLTLVDTKTQSKVPWLSKLPCIGALFKNNYKKESQKELIIFITPRIITEPPR